MSTAERTHERVSQKLRTRRALLAAARELVADGRTPTVAETADVAAPTAESLFPDETAPQDAEDRAALVQNALYDLARDHEAEFRLFLRNSLLRALEDPDGTGDPFRGARRSDLLD